MVKIILIARKTDGLILSENSDESSEDKTLFNITKKSKEMLTRFADKKGDCSMNLDSEDFSIQ